MNVVSGWGRRAGTAGLIACVLGLGGCLDVFAKRSVDPASLDPAINLPPGGSEDFVVNVGRRTFFKEASADLDSVAKETLEKQANWLQRYPRWSVKIQGFADDPGSGEANVAISTRRAQAVRTYLASLGVSEERISAKGYGRDRPVQSCAELACKVQNRRVVTNLVGDKDL